TSAAKFEEESMCMLKRDLTTPDSLQEIIRELDPCSSKCIEDSSIGLELDVLIFIILGEKLQGKCLRNVSPESPVKLYCCYIVIMVLTVAVIGLSIALSDVRNWTFSQTYCMALEAHLALYDSLEELNFLKRYKGASDYWIGLHRESPEHPWAWTDNTEYNNLVFTQGNRECAYLSDSGISSAKDYTPKKWICSKYSRYTLQCPEIFNP
ncbi:hypothetical protein U0070_002906, partial [Myodes glareolus]